jgi:RNA polymerase sigma-70 factor, ECF subfamily
LFIRPAKLRAVTGRTWLSVCDGPSSLSGVVGIDPDAARFQVHTAQSERHFETGSVAIADEEIVLRALDGDAPLFEVLMRRYNQRLFGAARAILRTDADAVDAVQQTYLNAYRHLGRFQGRSRFSTWLTRIVVYQALAQRRRVRDTLFGPDNEEVVGSAPSSTPDPERQAYVAELGALLESALAALPDGYRSVFMLREVHGLNTADTARQLCVTEGTVKTRLHRAKDLLQRRLQDVTPIDAFRFDGARCDRLVAADMPRVIDSILDNLPRDDDLIREQLPSAFSR